MYECMMYPIPTMKTENHEYLVVYTLGNHFFKQRLGQGFPTGVPKHIIIIGLP